MVNPNPQNTPQVRSRIALRSNLCVPSLSFSRRALHVAFQRRIYTLQGLSLRSRRSIPWVRSPPFRIFLPMLFFVSFTPFFIPLLEIFFVPEIVALLRPSHFFFVRLVVGPPLLVENLTLFLTPALRTSRISARKLLIAQLRRPARPVRIGIVILPFALGLYAGFAEILDTVLSTPIHSELGEVLGFPALPAHSKVVFFLFVFHDL